MVCVMFFDVLWLSNLFKTIFWAFSQPIQIIRIRFTFYQVFLFFFVACKSILNITYLSIAIHRVNFDIFLCIHLPNQSSPAQLRTLYSVDLGSATYQTQVKAVIKLVESLSGEPPLLTKTRGESHFKTLSRLQLLRKGDPDYSRAREIMLLFLSLTRTACLSL